MRFRLITVVYAVALFAASMVVAGVLFGGMTTALILAYWGRLSRQPVSEPISGAAAGCLATAIATTIAVGIALFSVCTFLETGLPRIHDNYGCRERITLLLAGLDSHKAANGNWPPVMRGGSPETPWHSWRTAILPQLGNFAGTAATSNYHEDEPWNSKKNLEFPEPMPREFECPRRALDAGSDASATTSYLRIHANDAPRRDAFESPILVEVARGVHWTQPKDLSLDEAIDLLTTSDDAGHADMIGGYFWSQLVLPPRRAMAYISPQDGSATSVWVRQFDDPADAMALLAAMGQGQSFEEIVARERPTNHRPVVHWRNIYGVMAVAVIALLPGIVLRRERRAARAAMALSDAPDSPAT